MEAPVPATPIPITAAPPNRFWLGVRRGMQRQCPNCGLGHLFAGYLKVAATCDRCGHPNGLYRADDAPPYFTILIVGHLIIAPMLAFRFIWTWPLGWVLGLTMPTILFLTLGLLPIVKGAVIGFHWATHPEATPSPAPPAV